MKKTIFIIALLSLLPLIIQSAAIQDNVNMLIVGVNTDNIEDVKKAIEAGVNVNCVDPNQFQKNTVLHIASLRGNTEIVNQLIHSKANVNAENKLQSTPLHYGVERVNQNETVHVLIKAKADINAKNSFGCTALHVAATESNYDVVKILLEIGANYNLIDNNGKNALASAWKETIAKAINDFIKLRELALVEIPKILLDNPLPLPLVNLITHYSYGFCEAEENNNKKEGDKHDKL